MSRFSLCRPLLLAALACLLTWAAISHALPMDASSSTTHGLNRLTGSNGHVSTSSELQGDALDVWLANQVHYRGYPILDARVDGREVVDFARSKYGAVYIYQSAPHSAANPVVSMFEKGARAAELVSANDRQAILEQRQLAQDLGRERGYAARWLTAGHPFGARFTSIIPSWKSVWKESARYEMPSSQHDPMWMTIRHNLQEQRRVVIHDTARSEMTAFRLSPFGKVEMEVKSLAADVKPLLRAMVKRGYPLAASSSSASQQLTLEDVLNDGQPLYIPSDLQRTSEEWMDPKYAHIIHFQGRPVFEARAVDLDHIQKALLDYGEVYVYGTKQGAVVPVVVKLIKDGRPIDPAPYSDHILHVINYARQLGQRRGLHLRALVFGRPIPKSSQFSEGSAQFFHGGPQGRRLDLQQMRSALSRLGRIEVHNMGTGEVLSLTLKENGLAHLVVQQASRLRQDIRIRSLAKRGLPFPADSSSSSSSPSTSPLTIENVVNDGLGLEIPPALRKTEDNEMDRKYASILHFRGLPVFDVQNINLDILRQALVDYGSAYVFGTKRGARYPTVVWLSKLRQVYDPAEDARHLLQIIEQSRLLEQSRGSALRAVVDGRPIVRAADVVPRTMNLYTGGFRTLDLHQLRYALAHYEAVHVHHTVTGETLELHFNARGLTDIVRADTADLAQHIRGRSLSRRDSLLGVLTKRMEGSSSRSGSPTQQDPRLRLDLNLPAPLHPTLEEVVNGGEPLPIPSHIKQTPAAEMDRKYATVLHYYAPVPRDLPAHVVPAFGVPAYDVRKTSMADIQQALVDYLTVVAYGPKQGSDHLSAVTLHFNAPPGHDVQMHYLNQLIDESRAFEELYGTTLHALKYGPLIRGQQNPDPDVVAIRDSYYFAHDTTFAHELRMALGRHHDLWFSHAPSTALRFRLNPLGTVSVLVRQLHRMRKRDGEPQSNAVPFPAARLSVAQQAWSSHAGELLFLA